LPSFAIDTALCSFLNLYNNRSKIFLLLIYSFFSFPWEELASFLIESNHVILEQEVSDTNKWVNVKSGYDSIHRCVTTFISAFLFLLLCIIEKMRSRTSTLIKALLSIPILKNTGDASVMKKKLNSTLFKVITILIFMSLASAYIDSSF
jgi:hypothetical protein